MSSGFTASSISTTPTSVLSSNLTSTFLTSTSRSFSCTRTIFDSGLSNSSSISIARSPSATFPSLPASSPTTLSSIVPFTTLSISKVVLSTSDSPVVKASNSTKIVSNSSSQSSPLTMSSAPRTSNKADDQGGDTPAPPPPTTSQSSTSSVSEVSNKTISETPSSSLSPRTSQSSGSQAIATNTTQSSTSLDSTNSPLPSTTTSVVFAKGTAPSTTVINTITESPESTLKSAVGVVVTQPDGHTTFSYPPVVTVFSTSLLPNGSYITFTHAVANPTGANEANGSSDTKSFFDNHGAVAGVFLAVGVILASIASCVFFLIRRRRKRKSHSSTERWIEDMQRLPQTPRYTDDPFVDQPPMSAVDGDIRVSTRSPDRFQLDDGGPLIPLTPTYQTAPVLMASPIQRKQPPIDDGPFSDSNALSPIKERNLLVVDETRRPALQVSRQSTPSLYPPTDKDEYEDIDLDAITPAQRRPLSDTSASTSRPTSAEIQPSPTTTVPPRPPRSILRAPSKVYEPYTPPPSESNHSSSESPTSPVSENPFRLERQPRPVRSIGGEDVFTRPTLLNVRPRSKGQ